MLETAIALLFAHVVADFVLQSDRMVRDKRRPRVLLAHTLVVAATAWAALGLALAPWPVVAVAGSHLVIDWLKLRFGGLGFRPFAVDQAGHLAAIAVVATAWPDAYAGGLWQRPEAVALLPTLSSLPAAMALAAGLVATVWAGSYAVGAVMQGVQLPPDPADDPSLPRGGRLIGQLERLIIMILALSGEIVGIGLLIAAKSILRFGEVQKSRQVAEYVIIGTLASFAWALAVSLATVRLLAAL